MRFDLVVNTMTAKALIDGKIPVFGGGQFRPNLHVEDAAEAFIACIEAPVERVGGEIFNAGSSGLNMKIIDIGRAVEKIVPGSKLAVSEKNVDKRDYFVDFRKIEKQLGFRAKRSIEFGISEVMRWMKENSIKSYSEKKYSNYEYLVNLNNSRAAKQ
jgi:nucleoside-diphosphate-sugar epimerase